ncbi:hypothetical protein N7493_006550 [Penicillium malachiteum]|uniref:Heme oxygenase-like protein n=1 Tax=Penicillium malachiteum TaxID=1324776 RepID=A0AAD6HKS3_9EURO|nr:hypothetical protein N7493_006550 [Penicillium malachiteum]
MIEEDLLLKLRTAIKEPHAAIHRLNLSRIALCVPPQVDKPTLYALGISRYAEIFYGLEEEWVKFIGDPADWIDQDSDDRSPSCLQDRTERVRALLRQLYMPELLRSRSLWADLAFLESIDPANTGFLHGHNAGMDVRKYLHQLVAKTPHLLVAWIWILYSAILYGGREIRAHLLKAGPQFWDLSAAEIKAKRTPCPLSFWHIEDDAVVKTKFRSLITSVDCLLTREEHQEILDESLQIFQKLEQLTLSLDEEAKVFPQ